MKSFVLSPEAEEDIFEIWSYLANEVNVEFADQIESNLFDAFALLSRNPGLGHNSQQPLTELLRYSFPETLRLLTKTLRRHGAGRHRSQFRSWPFFHRSISDAGF